MYTYFKTLFCKGLRYTGLSFGQLKSIQNPELANDTWYVVALTVLSLASLFVYVSPLISGSQSTTQLSLHCRQNTGALMPTRSKARCSTGVDRPCTGCLGSGTRASIAVAAPPHPRASGEQVSFQPQGPQVGEGSWARPEETRSVGLGSVRSLQALPALSKVRGVGLLSFIQVSRQSSLWVLGPGFLTQGSKSVGSVGDLSPHQDCLGLPEEKSVKCKLFHGKDSEQSVNWKK